MHPAAVKGGESFYTKGDGKTWSLWVRATREGKIKGADLNVIDCDEVTKFKIPRSVLHYVHEF